MRTLGPVPEVSRIERHHLYWKKPVVNQSVILATWKTPVVREASTELTMQT